MFNKTNIFLLSLLCLTNYSSHAISCNDVQSFNPIIESILVFPGSTSLKGDLIFIEDPTENIQLNVSIKSVKNGETLWQGHPKILPGRSSENPSLYFEIEGLNPGLWTPGNPVLYSCTFSFSNSENELVDQKVVRTGFRSFETKGGQILLNGKPIFLRGIAINPPGRGIPKQLEKSKAFALDYVRFMKSINVNIIRIPDNQNWYDVCDELGMMVFGGNYSSRVNGEKPPKVFDEGVEWYKWKKFAPIVHHPSLMIYALTNEVPYKGEIAIKWEKFLDYAHNELRNWDENRLYIGNAGYGYGKSGDICDLHRYWGWYYSSPFTFLNIRDNNKFIPFEKGEQPITFSECVGNYTGPDGRYNLTPNHKNPVSQLSWTGHASQSLQKQLANNHQSFTFKTVTELFRRLRPINPELSGVMPFTILFYNWHTVNSFLEMDPKPVTNQAKVSYQPVLLSWELWTPQIYSGSIIRPIVHVINDSDDFSDLQNASLIYQMVDRSNTLILEDTINLEKIPYYSTKEVPIEIRIPQILPTGYYKLKGRIVVDNKLISQNEESIFVASPSFVKSSSILKDPIQLFDPYGNLKEILVGFGLNIKDVSLSSVLDTSIPMIISENALANQQEYELRKLHEFVNKGGRILCLRQDTSNFPKVNMFLPSPVNNITMDIDNPLYPPPIRPSRNGFNINPERPEHPVFSGLGREQLRIWSDYTNWDERQEGLPITYPVTDGFTLLDKNDVKSTSILANYSVGLEGIALAEFFSEKGSVILCGFNLEKRSGLDPVADKMLLNLVGYVQQNENQAIHPFIDSPIRWGEYETEKGILTGIYSGLMLNSRPNLTGSYKQKTITIHQDGHQYVDNFGGWNNRAGLQYIPFGRRPFGPYFHRGFGGIPKPNNPEEKFGEGKFWCTVSKDKEFMLSTVWNPSGDKILIEIIINGLKTNTEMLEPGKTIQIRSNIGSHQGNLSVKYIGDRRLVIMETAFE